MHRVVTTNEILYVKKPDTQQKLHLHILSILQFDQRTKFIYWCHIIEDT